MRHRPISRSLAAALAAVLAVPAAGEFRVNTYTPGDQRDPMVAATAGGGAVVVWSGPFPDQPNNVNILARRYDAAGVALGPEFRVSTSTFDNAYPTVAAAAAGGFVVSWTNAQGVFARRFDGAGAALGPEFAVNSETTGRHRRSSVASDADGDFVVAWQRQTQDASSVQYNVFLRRYDASGAPQGPQQLVNAYTTGDQARPWVAAAPAGEFMVVWHARYADGSGHGIKGRRYDAAGSPTAGEFQVNAYTTGGQVLPTVESDAAGNFLVAWEGPDGAGLDGSGIFARRFDAIGGPPGPEFAVKDTATGDLHQARVAFGSDGGFTVAWAETPYGIGGNLQVSARQFDAAGAPRGGPFRVNAYDVSSQGVGDVAFLGSEFLVVWQSFQQDGDWFGVYGERLGQDGLFADGFESDGPAAWSALSTDGGDLAVTPVAGMGGSALGLEATVDDTAGLYVEDQTPAGESRYRARFYLDPSGFDPGEGTGHHRTRVFVAFADNPSRRVLAVVLKRQLGAYSLMARLRQDDGTHKDTAFLPLSDAPHWIELDWRRAAEPGAHQGALSLWIDGALAATLDRVNNGSAVVDFVRLGALSVKPTAGGTLRWDEFDSRRLTYIGPSVP